MPNIDFIIFDHFELERNIDNIVILISKQKSPCGVKIKGDKNSNFAVILEFYSHRNIRKGVGIVPY